MDTEVECKAGVKIGSLCINQNDFLEIKKSVGPVTHIKWGEYEEKYDAIPRGYYHVNIIAPNNDLILAVADPKNHPPFISKKHIYKITPKKLAKADVGEFLL